jgi:hypothetical protein
MICVTHHIACACREAAHAEEIARLTRELDAARAHRTIAVRERDIALHGNEALVARLTDALEARDRAVREYLAAESALNAAHEERLNACHSPITSPDGLRATEDTHTAALLRRIAAHKALRALVEGDR